MKKPVVDYREFRPSRLNEPRFSHLKLLLGWVVYFVFYFLTENFIPVEKCHPMHSFMDDLIPFNEYFAIFYCLWYVLIFGSLLYYLLYDVEQFKKLQIFIIVTQVIAMACYIIYPSRQDLRPDTFLRDNFFTDVMAFIYAFDTSTGVCPSLHVGYSLGVLSVTWKSKRFPKWGKALILLLVIMISLSTMFVKQHSFIDVLMALPLGLIAEIITYGGYWKEKFANMKKSKLA